MVATKRKLLEHLLDGPATAAELAEALDVSTTAARRHAEDLTEAGAARPFLRQEGVGRPSKYYRITEEGRERFPRAYDVVAAQIVSALDQTRGRQALDETMEAVGRRLAEAHRERVDRQAPLAARVEALEEVLAELGFPTEVEVQDDRFVLVRRDCIFLRLAREHRDAVCEHLDTTMLEEMVGSDVELEGCIPDGRDACRHVIERGRDPPEEGA